MKALESLLSDFAEVEDYLADRADVIDGDYGVPDPNEEMRLHVLLCQVREKTNVLAKAGYRVIAAFSAHGTANGVMDTLTTRQECEAAMVALDKALNNLKWQPPF